MIVFDPDLQIFYSTLINDDGFFSGFSTRALGDARRIDPIFRFFVNNKVDFKKIVVLEQIHSVNIQEYISKDTENFTKIEETDGVVSSEPKTVLTARTGDCCPLIFADKKKGILGVSHQGWRGSLKRMAQKMVDKMVSLGSEPKDIKVAIGPTIGECCYDIDDDRYYEFLEEFEGHADKIFHFRGGKRHLNLTLLNFNLLIDAGIPKENIDHFPFCTKCDTKRFFSFRRDRKKEDYGEMFSFIIKK
jgi:YfiH family protein